MTPLVLIEQSMCINLCEKEGEGLHSTLLPYFNSLVLHV